MRRMPQSRRSGLIVKEVDSEILIYDQETNKAHCLNETAAEVWKHCDGKTTVGEVCSSLGREQKTSVDEKLVWFALDQFAKDHLLEKEFQTPPFMSGGMTRRQLVRALGMAAIVAVPLVTTIVAPTPAQAAATLLPSGSCCSSSIQCVSQVCDFSQPPNPCTPNGVCT